MAFTEKASLLDEAKPTPVSLTWQSLSYVVEEKVRGTGPMALCRSSYERKTIIDNVSGYVKPGHLLAIMGTCVCRGGWWWPTCVFGARAEAHQRGVCACLPSASLLQAAAVLARGSISTNNTPQR